MARIARLQVLETVSAGAIETVRVQDPADGSVLLAHYGDFTLLSIADELGSDVLEKGESGGRLYMLTPDRERLRNLNRVESAAPAASAGPGEFTRMFQAFSPHAQAEKPAVSAQPSPADALGKPEPATPEPATEEQSPPPVAKANSSLGLTAMFSAVSRVAMEPEATSPAPAQPKPLQSPVRVPEPPPPSVKAEEPQRARPVDGEFTRMFQASVRAATPAGGPPAVQPSASAPVATPAPATPAAPAATPASIAPAASIAASKPDEPGAFTRMFATPVAPASSAQPYTPPLPAKPEPAAHDSGEFTRFFQSPLPPSREPDWKAIERQPPPPPQAKPEGDFTRMFGAQEGRTPQRPASLPGAPAGSASSSEADTDLFARPSSSPPPKSYSGSGDDFSKIISRPPAATPATPATVTAAAASDAKAPAVPVTPVAVDLSGKKPPMVALILIVVALMVAAGCAIYFFVFKHK